MSETSTPIQQPTGSPSVFPDTTLPPAVSPSPGPVETYVAEGEAVVSEGETIANTVDPNDARLTAIEVDIAMVKGVIDRLAPIIDELISVQGPANSQGHSLYSILTQVGSKLLGITF